MADFVGKYVSVDCGTLGHFQGQISEVNRDQLTLVKAFCNGSPVASTSATLKRDVIKDLKMIDVPNPEPNGVRMEKPMPVKRDFHISSIPSPVVATNCNGLDVQHNVAQGQPKREKLKNKKDEEAFGGSIASSSSRPDFDFEKNLALFDKKAVYDEINASRPDLLRQTEKNYRCNENVIVKDLKKGHLSQPQIIVPVDGQGETFYVTDNGILVPSVTLSQRRRLFSLAEQHGLSFTRMAELMGRAAAEMALQQVGGSHRLQPGNEHQGPCIVIACGNADLKSSAFAVNAARQLASFGVNTILYLSPLVSTAKKTSKELAAEVELYRLTHQHVAPTFEYLNQCAADLIIIAGFEGECDIAYWAQEHRASVLGIDPPETGITGIMSKCSLVPCLPLSYNSITNGKIYVCNIPIPYQIFYQAGIRYKSPFGAKSVLPIYPKNE